MIKINRNEVEKEEIELERRRQIVDLCLEQFVKKGLMKTTSRDLSNALKLQNAGMYYYFKSKDEVIVVCAEEAAFKIEKCLIIGSFDKLDDLDLLFRDLREKADDMAPMMKFFVQVVTTSQYHDAMLPVLERLNERYKDYAQRIADKLNADFLTVKSYFYMCITAVTNYMIFNNDECCMPQIQLIKSAFNKFKSANNYLNSEEITLS